VSVRALQPSWPSLARAKGASLGQLASSCVVTCSSHAPRGVGHSSPLFCSPSSTPRSQTPPSAPPPAAAGLQLARRLHHGVGAGPLPVPPQPLLHACPPGQDACAPACHGCPGAWGSQRAVVRCAAAQRAGHAGVRLGGCRA